MKFRDFLANSTKALSLPYQIKFIENSGRQNTEYNLYKNKG